MGVSPVHGDLEQLEWEATGGTPTPSPQTPTLSPQVCGCDSVSSCPTSWAVVNVALPDLLREHTNCRCLLDLFLENVPFQQPANLLGAAEALLPWLNGGLWVCILPVRPRAGCRLKSQRTKRKPLRLTWHAGWLRVGCAVQRGESWGGGHLCPASAVLLITGQGWGRGARAV